MFVTSRDPVMRFSHRPAPRTVERHIVLDRAAASQAAEQAAAVQVLAAAVEWAALHATTDVDESAAFMRHEGHAVPIAGPGAPLVTEWACDDFATSLGLKSEHGMGLMGEALELAHRLPLLWAEVLAGRVPAWKARRIARATMNLSVDAAAFVDQHVAHFATRIGITALDRLVADATGRFMPETAEKARRDAMDRRRADVDVRQVSFEGTCTVHAELDYTDALDLDQAIAAGAEALAAAGSTEKADVRRAMALGDLARGEVPLPLTGDSDEGAAAAEPGVARRQVVLHVHLSEAAVVGVDAGGRRPTQHGRVEGTGTQGGRALVTAETIRGWCATAGQVRVVPVIDLNQQIHVEAYEIPDRLHAQVNTRDLHCIFPWCERAAAACDTDHIRPYDKNSPPGTEQSGPTASDNLAPLCRRHHRLKTSGRWDYRALSPGTYLWTAPYDRAYLVDHTGTTDVSTKSPPARE